MIRWILTIAVLFSPLAFAADPNPHNRMVEIENEIRELREENRLQCERLAEVEGGGQAAVACEDFRQNRIVELQKELAGLRHGLQSPSTLIDQSGMSGDATR